MFMTGAASTALAGLIRVDSRVLLTDRHGVAEDDITRWFLDGQVDLDLDRAVSPLMLRGELRRSGIVTPYRDHIQPWLRLEYPNGTVIDEPVGLYSVAPAPRRHSYRRTAEQITGYDHTWRLATSSFAGVYSVPAGANVIAAVQAILRSDGFVAGEIALAPSSKVLTAAISWGLDLPAVKLEIVNALLAAIAYVPLHMTRYGLLASFPLPDLESGLVDRVFGAGADLLAEIVEDPNVDQLCNVVRVINTRDGLAPIVATAENHNPDSPVSIENLGRMIVREIRDSNIPDQATADTIAAQTLQAGATYDNQVTITSFPDPTRNPYDVYEFAVPQLSGDVVLAGRWRCLGWSLGFTTRTTAMTHRIGKVVSGTGVTGG